MNNSVVVYQTLSGNTKEIAEAIAEGAKTKAIRVGEVKESDLAGVELVFIGSGIYGGSHHKQIVDFVKKLRPLVKVFIFSTAGAPRLKKFWHLKLKNVLKRQRGEIIGEVCFPGYDLFGPLKWFGGLNKNRPNELDIKKAREIGKRFNTG